MFHTFYKKKMDMINLFCMDTHYIIHLSVMLLCFLDDLSNLHMVVDTHYIIHLSVMFLCFLDAVSNLHMVVDTHDVIHLSVMLLCFIDAVSNLHMVVDCDNEAMKDHCYWPVVSDLINLLSHRNIAHQFLKDNQLITLWLELLSYFQGIHINYFTTLLIFCMYLIIKDNVIEIKNHCSVILI